MFFSNVTSMVRKHCGASTEDSGVHEVQIRIYIATEKHLDFKNSALPSIQHIFTCIS